MSLIKKQLDRVPSTDTKIKVVMTEKVLREIQYLCREIAAVEWSGILFYRTEGSIHNPAEMVMTLETILPMHKGTQAYTEYTFDERVVEFLMDNPNVEDCKMGHIHSHNNMSVFFSGTDWSELEDNAPNHNLYLSLIVNNAMDFCAKVCFIAEGATEVAQTVEYKAKDEAGHYYVYSQEEVVVQTKDKLVVYDCDIQTPGEHVVVDEDFKAKVAGIIAKANVVTVTYPRGGTHHNLGSTGHRIYAGGLNTPPSTPKYYGGWDGWDDDVDVPPSKPTLDLTFPKEKKSLQEDRNRVIPEGARTQGTGGKKKKVQMDYHSRSFINTMVSKMEFNADVWAEVIENFTMFILNTGNNATDYSGVPEICEEFSKHGITGKTLLNSVLEDYNEAYENFFVQYLTDVVDEDERRVMYLSVLDSVIKRMSYEMVEAPVNSTVVKMLTPIKEGLQIFKRKLDVITIH